MIGTSKVIPTNRRRPVDRASLRRIAVTNDVRRRNNDAPLRELAEMDQASCVAVTRETNALDMTVAAYHLRRAQAAHGAEAIAVWLMPTQSGHVMVDLVVQDEVFDVLVM